MVSSILLPTVLYNVCGGLAAVIRQNQICGANVGKLA